MKRKKLGISISIIIILVFILSIVGYLSYSNLTSQNLIQPGVCSSTETGSTFNSFTCPSDADSCDAVVSLECNTQLTQPLVIYRASDSSSSPDQFAYKFGESLTSYIEIGSSLTWMYSLPGTYLSNLGFYIYDCLSYKCIARDANSMGTRYTAGGSISTSTSLLQTETCADGNIICEETNSYSCSQSITGNLQGSPITLNYNDNVAGSVDKAITLNPGESMNWNGQIDYTIFRNLQSECTPGEYKTDEFDNRIYYLCESDANGCGFYNLANQLVCPQGTIFDNTLQTCKPPYSVTINLEKDIVAVGEDFKIDFTLDGSSNDGGKVVTLSLLKNGIIQTTESQLTLEDLYNEGQASLSVPANNVGYYELRVSLQHPDGDFEKTYNVEVTQGLTLQLFSQNQIQYDNKPIELRLQAKKGTELKELVSRDLEATFRGSRVYPTSTKLESKIYIYQFDLKGDGTLRARAKGSDETGFTTDWTQYYDITVKQATINIDTDFSSSSGTGNIRQKFTTKDSQGQLIDTTNIVNVERPLGGIVDTVNAKKVSTGNYEFSYNFDEGGLYTIKITSTAPGIGTYSLNEGLGEVVNIVSTTGGGTGEDDSNYTMYLIIGGILLGLSAFVYFTFIRRRR